MKTGRTLGSFVALLAGAFAAGAAHGTTWNTVGGGACQVDDGRIMYSDYGAANPQGDESSNFICSLGMGTQSSHPRTHDHVAILYQDSSNAYPFSCRVCQLFNGGSSSCTDLRYTCGTWGGCGVSQQQTSYTGQGLLVWFTGDMPSNVRNQFVDAHYYVWCNVPPYASGGSYITEYWSGEG